jgi:hypothetical protein
VRLTQEPLGGSKYTGEVTPLPGCPDMAVSHAVYRMTGTGMFGKAANLERLQQLRDLGYSAVMCTVENNNVRQMSIMLGCGWQACGVFLNKRTQHHVALFFHEL